MAVLKEFINIDDFIQKLVDNHIIFKSSVGWIKIE